VFGEIEHFFICPYCFSNISMVIEIFHDSQGSRQKYIEDCEVCCSPIEIEYAVGDGELTKFEVKSIDD